MRRAAAAGAALVLAGGLAPVVSPIGVGVGAATAAEAVAIPFDFDGDGYADLAVGVPGESLRGKRAAGAVQVPDGSSRGLTARAPRCGTKVEAFPWPLRLALAMPGPGLTSGSQGVAVE